MPNHTTKSSSLPSYARHEVERFYNLFIKPHIFSFNKKTSIKGYHSRQTLLQVLKQLPVEERITLMLYQPDKKIKNLLLTFVENSEVELLEYGLASLHVKKGEERVESILLYHAACKGNEQVALALMRYKLNFEKDLTNTVYPPIYYAVREGNKPFILFLLALDVSLACLAHHLIPLEREYIDEIYNLDNAIYDYRMELMMSLLKGTYSQQKMMKFWFDLSQEYEVLAYMRYFFPELDHIILLRTNKYCSKEETNVILEQANSYNLFYPLFDLKSNEELTPSVSSSLPWTLLHLPSEKERISLNCQRIIHEVIKEYAMIHSREYPVIGFRVKLLTEMLENALKSCVLNEVTLAQLESIIRIHLVEHLSFYASLSSREVTTHIQEFIGQQSGLAHDITFEKERGLYIRT